MRVHILAKELNVSSKVVLEKCRAEGLGDIVKNHMSALNAGLEATIREWFSEGSHTTAVETAAPVDLERVRVRRRRQAAQSSSATAVEELEETDEGFDVDAEIEAPLSFPVGEAPAPLVEAPPAVLTRGPEAPAAPADQTSAVVAEAPPEAAQQAGAPAPAVEEQVAPSPLVETPSAEPATAQREAVAAHPASVAAPPRPGEGQRDEAAEQKAPARRPKPVVPAGPQNVPAPARISGPRVVRYEAPEQNLPTPRARPAARERSVAELGAGREPLKEAPRRSAKEEALERARAKGRRSTVRDSETQEKLLEWRDQDLAERRARLKGATGRRIHRRRSDGAGPGAATIPAGRKAAAVVNEPVTVREFCNATGVNQIQVCKALQTDHDLIAGINTILPLEVVQLMALELGIELEVVPAKSALDRLEEEFAQRERRNLQSRPPVVTMMGHVDHGKTSLLDAIRRSRVVDDEDGGITQHISSYHLKRGDIAVTFLDTPGHQAFTAMRARGANLTDIVVLVVAADDGVMPQTIEAMNHAKAAGTPIVVALNKIDLGRQNEMKIFGQLAEHELAPVAWGGTTEVVGTSAVTGEGIDKLLETLTTLAELMELTADPTVDAAGRVIEAETRQGVGAVARVLVQEGVLSVGDIVVCGNAYGKVRALVDDRGKRIKQAGPGIPAEIWGLSDVPGAGDRFYRVDNMQRASGIADEVSQARLIQARAGTQKALSLEDALRQRDAGEIPELNVILKADVQGSVDALRHTLSDIPSNQVRLNLRHAGVGPVNDSDILLAAASQAIVIGFRVQTTAGTHRLAEEHGVDVRQYLVIYDVVNDIRKALEGLLAPEEHVEARATLEVRQVFRVSKVGRVAGCMVVAGPVARDHLARVVRDGVVVRDRCPIASLRHFKDDVKEVRAGLECGIMLAGFDDVHVGDMIETVEVVKVARTLD